MENKGSSPPLDSDDEGENLFDESPSSRKGIFLPAPIFGRPTSTSLLLDDDDEEDDDDDPPKDVVQNEAQAPETQGRAVVEVPSQSIAPEPVADLPELPNEQPTAQASSVEHAPSVAASASGLTSTAAAPAPRVIIAPTATGPPRSSSSLRSALKTVHSGRSLSSHGSPKTKRPTLSAAPLLNSSPPPLSRVRNTTMRKTEGSRSSFRSQEGASATPPAASRAAQFASRLARRTRFGPQRNSNRDLDLANLSREQTPSSGVRRYKPGDLALVCNHQSRWANLVNRYGFPPGEGATPDEQRGPYIYVIATVKEVHFEEFAAYYTVERRDTGAEQRADADFMEPLRNGRGEAAAIKAATQLSGDEEGQDGEFEGSLAHDPTTHVSTRSKVMSCIQTCCFYLILPFLWLYDCLHYVGTSFLRPLCRVCSRHLRARARLFLNGRQPFMCRARLTMVNFIVLCSTWYMFIDQARLAFFPPEADKAVSAINLAVWLVLVLELAFEVFIRPDGFRNLIISDKAYAPTTVRFINAIHLSIESLCLLMFAPEWYCLMSTYECDDRLKFSFYNAVLMSATGPTRLKVFYGRSFMALIRLRVFGLVRHWKNMWIANTFINTKWKSSPTGILSTIIPRQRPSRRSSVENSMAEGKFITEHDDTQKKDTNLANASTIGTALMVTNSYRGLAIMWVITGLFPLLLCISSQYINSAAPSMTLQLQATNLLADSQEDSSCTFLADSTLSWMLSLTSPAFSQDLEDSRYLLNLDVQPPRCPNALFADLPVTVAACSYLNAQMNSDAITLEVTNTFCESWNLTSPSRQDIARELGLRTGSILLYQEIELANLTLVDEDGNISGVEERNYTVVASFDESVTVRNASICSLLLQLSMLVAVLGGLSVLRRDAEVLVLKPLRHMLKIVARYAKNPLVPPKTKRRSASSSRRRASSRRQDDDASYDSDDSSSITSQDGAADDELALGSYETEQLITAVTKITDLLRKCWGVAGADIISTNLATREGALTEVFNPTVPGKSVYALFGFAAINGFDHALKGLGGDIMILINDVAAVLHGEVFRWGFGDSGQCNKNLGSAFLMVFRIGLVAEVVEKLEQATDVIFSTGHTKSSSQSAAKRRTKLIAAASTGSSTSSSKQASATFSVTSASAAKHAAVSLKRKVKRSASTKAMSLSLESLPGISTFTDRAVIGMLKSFAGLYRDNKILNWNDDFRLGAGVGAFTVSMIYGMDAGWAVEGAVGSEYKIDATYLSPHVNMASRMMSACKMYGVNILLSQAVQELMSDVARSKLRHLDTVTVKGSSVKQRIYTYDARPKGVDFFLYSRSDEQADFDADRYSPNTWNNDQDLRAMRQHITEEFLTEFTAGRKAFLAGDWKDAIKNLERANELMIENALEEGYLEEEFEELAARAGDDARAAAEELKLQNGDGPSLYLISFMKSKGGVAPDRWEGWHPLMRK